MTEWRGQFEHYQSCAREHSKRFHPAWGGERSRIKGSEMFGVEVKDVFNDTTASILVIRCLPSIRLASKHPPLDIRGILRGVFPLHQRPDVGGASFQFQTKYCMNQVSEQ